MFLDENKSEKEVKDAFFSPIRGQEEVCRIDFKTYMYYITYSHLLIKEEHHRLESNNKYIFF